MPDNSSNQPPKKSAFDRKDPHPEDQVVADPKQEKYRKNLDQGLKDSFPASDPPAVSQPTRTGRKPRAG